MPAKGFRVEGADRMRILAVQLKAANPTLLRLMRRELRAVVVPIAAEVKAKAATFSVTIPASITIRTRFSGRTASVWIAALSSKLPDGHKPLARLQEFGSRRNAGIIRHPVFAAKDSAAYGDPNRWRNQPTHPFLYPTARAHGPEVELAMRKVMDDTARAAGFK